MIFNNDKIDNSENDNNDDNVIVHWLINCNHAHLDNLIYHDIIWYLMILFSLYAVLWVLERQLSCWSNVAVSSEAGFVLVSLVASVI